MPYNKLTIDERRVILDRGTERPFSGEYDNFVSPGTFICRQCNAPLFSSQAKFDAGCGWPSFDANYPDALLRIPSEFGDFAEIRCSHCGGHLGHVFEGEGFTDKDTRHCVNSLSIKFIPKNNELPKVLDEQQKEQL